MYNFDLFLKYSGKSTPGHKSPAQKLSFEWNRIVTKGFQETLVKGK